MELVYWVIGVTLACCLGIIFGSKKTEKKLTAGLDARLAELVEELELTASGIIVEIEQKMDDLQFLLDSADKKINIMRIARNEQAVATPAPTEVVKANSPAEPPPARDEMISRLSKQGLGQQEIAQKLNIGVGEVRLILGLLGKQDK